MLMLVAGIASIIPLTLIALLAVAVLACVAPVGVLVAAVAALPFFYRPISLGGQQFAASELLLALAAGGTAFQLLVSTAGSPRRIVQLTWSRLSAVLTSRTVIAAVILALVGALLVAMPFDPSHRSDSLREWRWTMLEPVLLLALLVWHRRERALPELAALALIVGGAFASLYALADLAVGGGVNVAGVTRIAGPYPHPNALALMTVRIGALGFAWGVLAPRWRRMLWPLTLVCGLAVAATFSRGAMLAAFVALLLVLLNVSPRVRVAGLSLAATGLVGAIIVARDRMLDLFGGGSGSLRIDVWSSAIEMIRDRPLVGYGPDQFLYAYLPRYVRPTAWGERFTAHAHNFLLDFWVRLGIIGAAFIVIALLICLATLARHMRDGGDGTPQPLRHAALVALIATFAHGMVDNAFFSHDLAMSCWLLAWLAFGVRLEHAGDEVGGNSARAGFGRGRVHRVSSLR